MLAVVAQNAIPALAQARARPFHHRAAIEASSVVQDTDCVATREALERNVLHRTAQPSIREAGVVNDPPVAGVDAVMRVERARGDEMSGEWGLTGPEQRIDETSMICPPEHGRDNMEVCHPIHRTKVSTDTLVQGWIRWSNRRASGALV